MNRKRIFVKLLFLVSVLFVAGYSMCACARERVIINNDATDEYSNDSEAGNKNGNDTDSEAEDEKDIAADNEGAYNSTELDEAVIVVFVCGAVKNEGVYELPSNSRINDALIAAGGFKKHADTDGINLAGLLSDGQQIYFPFEGESALQLESDSETDAKQGNSEDADGLVNINTADKEMLMTLPSIGEAKAKSIIEYREQNGSFNNKEDIKKVNGIGDSIYDKICEYITVGYK